MALTKSLWNQVRDKFIEIDSCWIWTGYMNPSGYGRVARPTPNKKHGSAHRILYELLVEDVPEGMELDHLCRNRACVNPNHLEPVTRAENLLRSLITNSGKTHCKNGHEFNSQNTYTPPSRPNRRHCKECQNSNSQKYMTKKKGELSCLYQ